tara:strand:- start:431 stop:637 length:207 start_codon:yes stop_codon:yes gene_type:complete
MKKYKVDEWVHYCPLPDVEYFKDVRERALILAVLTNDVFYDYRIYIEDSRKIKKVRESHLFSIPEPTY